MNGYLGEEKVDIGKSKYADNDKSDWAMVWIGKYGGYDGAHHKDWVLDQVSRIIKGTPVKIKLAKWDNGHKEYRFELGEPTQEYWDWVKYMKSGEDGEDTYDYEFGIAP